MLKTPDLYSEFFYVGTSNQQEIKIRITNIKVHLNIKDKI